MPAAAPHGRAFAAGPLLGAAAWLLAGPPAASACSYVEVEGPGGAWVIGRTMETSESRDQSAQGLGGPGPGAARPPGRTAWSLAVHPRGPDGRFSNRYGFVGLDAILLGHTDIGVSDGMNEAGLTLSVHAMRTAEYEGVEPGKMALSINEVIPWALGQFSSVPEVAAGLENVTVVPYHGATSDDFVHWALADAVGNSAVLEYVAGKRVLHRNDVRVMTNDPDFTWHLKNLNMYVGLTPQAPSGNAAITVSTEVGEVPKIWSHGFNLLGLPGDTSPASRFVRLFYLRQYAQLAEPVASVEDAIVLATGLLNNVFIPRGTVAPTNGPTSFLAYELTQYGLLKIPSQRRLLFRSYRNMAWREVNLSKLRWDQRRSIPVDDGTLGIQDVTGQLEAERSELVL